MKIINKIPRLLLDIIGMIAFMVAAFIAKHFGGVVGAPVDTPLPSEPYLITL